MKKKEKTKNKEQQLLKLLSALATIKQVFAALVIAHELDTPAVMTLLAKLNSIVLCAISKGEKSTLRDSYEELKEAMEILINLEEEVHNNESKKSKNNEQSIKK